MKEKPFLKPKEAAEIAEVHRVTLLGWIRSGRLPAEYINSRSIRIRREDLMCLLGGSPSVHSQTVHR